jgi:metallophosphoesterase (TIGR00282 family)
MRVIFFGDIFGRPGREALIQALPDIIRREQPDFVIANAENIAHGMGVTKKALSELLPFPLDCFTSGNHIFALKEAGELLNDESYRLLRPANWYPETPGLGVRIIEKKGKKLAVINLMGQVFMKQKVLSPLWELRRIVSEVAQETRNILVDFHAEATSEKKAFGIFADGVVSAVLGTHTHIPTADEQILSAGTAYISDVGMVGPFGSVLGLDARGVIENYLTQRYAHFEPWSGDRVEINFVVVDIDEKTGTATAIRRERLIVQNNAI